MRTLIKPSVYSPNNRVRRRLVWRIKVAAASARPPKPSFLDRAALVIFYFHILWRRRSVLFVQLRLSNTLRRAPGVYAKIVISYCSHLSRDRRRRRRWRKAAPLIISIRTIFSSEGSAKSDTFVETQVQLLWRKCFNSLLIWWDALIWWLNFKGIFECFDDNGGNRVDALIWAIIFISFPGSKIILEWFYAFEI